MIQCSGLGGNFFRETGIADVDFLEFFFGFIDAGAFAQDIRDQLERSDVQLVFHDWEIMAAGPESQTGHAQSFIVDSLGSTEGSYQSA